MSFLNFSGSNNKEGIYYVFDMEGEKPLKEMNMVVDSISFEKDNLYIVLDSDEIIDSNRITEASHLINEILDEKDFIKTSYILDISSKEKGEG